MQDSVQRYLAVDRPGRAGVIGGVSGVLAATVVTTADVPVSSDGLAVGILTALLFLVLSVAYNVVREHRKDPAPESRP